MTLCIPLIHDNGNTIIMDIREILRGFSKIQVDFQKNDLKKQNSNSIPERSKDEVLTRNIL